MSGHAQDVTLYSADALPALERSNGYILIGVDSGDTESFIVVTRLGAQERRARSAREKLAAAGSGKRIELAGKAAGFYFAMLPAGEYQVTEVSYPYFDLPFRLSTESDREWRFSVEEGKISYVGQLVVGRERSEKAVNVNLINRLAADYEHITSAFAALLEQYPLVSGIGMRDDFLEFLSTP